MTLDIKPLVLAAALSVSACATAGPRPVLTPEQVVSLQQVRQAAISPDGKTAAYVLSEPRSADEEPGGPHSALFVLRDGAKRPTRFSRADAGVSSIRFSPDGTRIFFKSRRGKKAKSQVYALPLAGGEAVAVTSAKHGVMHWTLSSDGASIAYISLAEPDEKRIEAAEAGADAQVHGAYYRQHLAYVMPVAGGEPILVSQPDRAAFELAFTPDGKSLAIMTSATPRNDDNYMFRTLSMISTEVISTEVISTEVISTEVISTKALIKPRKLAAGMGKMGAPRVSPDGRWVAFRGAADRTDGTTGTLWLVPTDGSAAPRALNAGAEETVYDHHWIGDRLIVSAVSGTRSTLSRRTLTGESEVLLDDGTIFLGVSVDAAGERVALAGNTARHPPELFVGDIDGPKRVTDHNPGLNKLSLGKQQTVTWTSSIDGLKLEGVLVLPVGYSKGKSWPLLVYPHGGPEWQALDGWGTRYLTAAQVFAAKGYMVMFPNYRGSSGRGAAFAKADHNDLGGKELQDIIDGVDHLAAKYNADPKRVGMMGASYGGYMSALAATKAHKHFAAAINFAGIGSWWSFMGTSDIPHEMSIVHWNQYCTDSPKASQACWDASPLAHIWETRTPLMVVHGAKDKRVPIGQARELHRAFQLRKIPTELVIYPREGHGLSERAHQLDLMERSIRWFEEHLQVAAP